MGDGGLVDTDSIGESLLAHPLRLSKLSDAAVDRPLHARSGPRLLAFHVETVDRRSTFVNSELTTDLQMAMRRSSRMGDSRHKKAPPLDDEEDVTPAFREAVKTALDLNKQRNKLSELRKGDSGYLISNRSELAEAIGTDKTMINKIIGPARADSKVKLVDRSAFVGRIRAALQLPAVTKIAVKASRAEILRRIAELPDDEFANFERALPKRK